MVTNIQIIVLLLQLLIIIMILIIIYINKQVRKANKTKGPGKQSLARLASFINAQETGFPSHLLLLGLRLPIIINYY